MALADVVLHTIFVVCGLTAPRIAPYSPAPMNLMRRFKGTSVARGAGADQPGRDALRDQPDPRTRMELGL